MGGFSKCLTDEDQDPKEDSENQEREKVPGRAGPTWESTQPRAPEKNGTLIHRDGLDREDVVLRAELN